MTFSIFILEIPFKMRVALRFFFILMIMKRILIRAGLAASYFAFPRKSSIS